MIACGSNDLSTHAGCYICCPLDQALGLAQSEMHLMLMSQLTDEDPITRGGGVMLTPRPD